MKNKLVWAFYHVEDKSEKFFTYINFNRLSIKRASSLGYKCKLITPEFLFKYFNDLDLELEEFNSSYSHFFDYTKHYILTNEKEPYIVIDGDLILNSRLPDLEADLIYEKPEVNNWSSMYEKYVNDCSNNDIKDIIPEWTGNKRLEIINIGLINLLNSELKELYLDRWSKFRMFIESHNFDNLVDYAITGSQYLLTEILDYHKFTAIDYRRNSNKNTYKHYLGNAKFNRSFIPKDKLLVFNDNLL